MINTIDLDQEYSDLIENREWLEHPEQRLIWAIIERAARDALGNQSSDVIAATEWFWASDSDQKLKEFSFEWCCENIGIDPDEFRHKILHMRRQLNKSDLPIAA